MSSGNVGTRYASKCSTNFRVKEQNVNFLKDASFIEKLEKVLHQECILECDALIRKPVVRHRKEGRKKLKSIGTAG